MSLLLLFPWLTPYTSGPAPNMLPWLLSAACGLLLWFFAWRRGLLSARPLALGWLVAAAISSLIACLQYFGFEAPLAPWVSQTDLGEAYGNLRQRNQFATLTSIGLAGLLFWVAQGERDHAMRIPAWAYGMGALLAVGNAVSSSRTGLLQWVALLVIVWWWRTPQRRKLAGFVLQLLLLYLVAVAALPWLLAAVTGQESEGLLGRMADAGNDSRLVLWANVIHLIAQKPWLGWGWGELDYAHFITLYPGPRFMPILDNAHNLPLHLAVELGVPLALLVCGCIAWLVWRGKPWHEAEPARQLAWMVLAAIGIHSLLEYPLWYGPFQLAVGLCVALLWRAAPRDGAAGLEAREAKTSWASLASLASMASVATFIALWGVLGYVAWDYHRVSQIYFSADQRSAAYRDNTLAKVKQSRLFSRQAGFAELTLTALTPANAADLNALAKAQLHHSPEPKVVETLIDSARLLGRQEEAAFYEARFAAAFPDEHAAWARGKVAGAGG